MATVYLAKELRHDRFIALKVMHPELAATLGPERFLREVRTTARLQHPHILPVLDSGEVAGLLWYTMPHVRGESLRERLQRDIQLPVEFAVDLARQVALALDCAHREGVIHRDLKPENILLSDGQALVADFGVAKAVSDGSEQLTQTGLALGTPTYMSPEQASGGRVDARSDIYALGCVLYEMLVGEPPFTGPTPQVVIAKRLTQEVTPVRQIRPTVPEALEDVIEAALARVPADRMGSAREFAERLVHVPTADPSGHRDGSMQLRSVRARPLRKTVLAMTTGILILGLAAAVFLLRDRNPPALDNNLLSVAPFEVLDPSLQLWEEGLVDLLSRNLDGAGMLRTVSPTVVVRRWRGRADRSSAEALARRTGAGLVLYGTLVPAGSDSIRLRASVVDMLRQQIVAEADIRGATGRIDQLADSLTIRTLDALGQSRAIGAVRASGLGSRSVPALRAFLHGEQAFRKTNWDSARGYYEAAIAQDTAFGLAYRRLGLVRGWVYGANDSLGAAYALRAGELNHGLAPRDSLLVVCDSLMATALEGATPDSATEMNLRRLFSTATLATRRYTADPETWVALGEARAHHGDGRGVSDAMTLEAFDRAIVLDSAYAPAYIHAVGLALRLGDRAAALQYARRFLELRPGGEDANGMRAASLLLDPSAPESAVESMLDTMSAPVMYNLYINFDIVPDSEETGIRLWRRLTRARVPEDQWYHDPEFRRRTLAMVLGFRGHVREAADTMMATDERPADRLFGELALLGAIPGDTLEATFRQLLTTKPFWPPPSALRFALPWWAGRRDSSSLKVLRERARAASLAVPGPDGLPVYLVAYYLAAANAYLALARGDSAEAVARLQALPIRTGGVWPERLTLARLLEAHGRHREAMVVLDAGYPQPWPWPSRGMWALERARVAERLGEREKAQHWYGYVLKVWRNSDPELHWALAEARQGLRRLTAEPKADVAAE